MASSGPAALTRLEIREAREREFVACERLMRDVYRFSHADSLPAWQMFAATLAGGITIVASAQDALVGAAHAFPAGPTMPETLYVVSLVVAPDARSLGTGRRLMEALKGAAQDRGYRRVRWSTDTLAIPLLHLYLNRLGARLTACLPALYDLVRPATARCGVPGDEFDVEWLVDSTDPTASRPAPVAHVSLPADGGVLAAADTAEARRCRERVRSQTQALFDRSLAGFELRLDYAAGEALLGFGSR